MNRIIKITDLINRNFYSLWLTEKSHVVAHGGRSSMKSSVISLKLLTEFLKDDNGNVVCLRKVAKYLSTSVYEQIKWAIYMQGVENEFYFGRSPLLIRHRRTNTAFYFYGVDDPLKLKSAKIARGYVMALWYEELAEFAGVDDINIVEDTFIREDLPDGKQVKVYFSYNPPRNPYEWVNEWVDEKRNDPDYFVHQSTYLDDEKGFLSAQLIRKIERYKANDYDYWRWMYNGEVIGLGDMVYNMNHFHWIDELPEDDDLLLLDIAIDSGYQTSATTFSVFGLTKRQNVILLDTYYYSPQNKAVKKAPSEFSADLHQFESNLSRFKKNIDMRTIDSAEGALRNQYFKDFGIRLHPINKKKKVNMIENVQDLLAQGRFFMLRNNNNQIFYEEHRKYQWDVDTLQSDDPKVIKEDDHTCDAFQYYVNDNLRKLNLKF